MLTPGGFTETLRLSINIGIHGLGLQLADEAGAVIFYKNEHNNN